MTEPARITPQMTLAIVNAIDSYSIGFRSTQAGAEASARLVSEKGGMSAYDWMGVSRSPVEVGTEFFLASLRRSGYSLVPVAEL